MTDILVADGPALIAPAWVRSAERALTIAHDLATGTKAAAPRRGLWNLSDLIARRIRLYDVENGVAVIQVSGLLLPKWGYVGCSWITGYDVLQAQLAQAFADPEVKGIVLEVDSGGGAAAGIDEMVEWAVEAKAAAGKPVVAILTSVAYSAAYWIAAGIADSIAVPRNGGLGSIGVVSLHVDYSALLAKEGIKISVITAGARKAEGHPFAPLPDDVLARWQKESEDLRRLFAATVVRGRNAAGAKLDKAAVLATEAGTWNGPAGTAEAVRLGYADVVARPDQALDAVIQFVTARK
jgi:capsid assembly protease